MTALLFKMQETTRGGGAPSLFVYLCIGPFGWLFHDCRSVAAVAAGGPVLVLVVVPAAASGRRQGAGAGGCCDGGVGEEPSAE